MNEKRRNIIVVIVMALFLFGLSLWSWIGKDRDYSESERRKLASKPKLSASTVIDGSFMSDFEVYAMDTFPMRDAFRGIKSVSELGVFRKLDNNGLYISSGHLSRIEYPYSERMLEHASERMNNIYDKFLANKSVNVYFSVIPDKNCFLAEKSGRLSLDYPAFIEEMKQRTDHMKYIDITDLLELDDFYRTDTHWRQERIVDVAKRLASEMGAELKGEYTENVLESPFKGVYYGQLAIPVRTDMIHYLTNDSIEKCKVTSYNTGKPIEIGVYNMDKAVGRDPYEMFLSGADPFIEIENPNADNDRELVIFRDSFGSSLAPLLIEVYSKITLVDIRYMQSEAVGAMVGFNDQDVLFMYSTLILNNSLALR